MKKSIIKTADNVEKAIDLGLKELSKSRDEVEVEIMEEGKTGVLGIFGKKEAVVKISYEDEFIEREIDGDIDNIQEDLSIDDSEVIHDDLDTTFIEETKDEDFSILASDDEIVFEDDKDLENEIDLKNNKNENLEQIESDNENIEDTSEEKVSLEDEELLDEENISEVEKFYRAKEFLTNIFEDMHVDAKIYGNMDEENHIKFDVKVNKKDVGIVIGKKGQTLNALEILLRKAINKSSHFPRITLDINNYKKRNDEKIISFASICAKKVLKSKRSFSFKPMNAYSRKLIHSEVSKYQNLTTHSEGNEPKRYVVIEYKED
ncbi:MAG: RNA-binding cell elongation regulator Jag/EloR [Peptoniphilaceae bacterium]|nr:Jag N-terminal domain-containing protein [Peptoniphilaceae bacterium]MDY3738536.1 RNA-binding cell elongation regulator Jag/EloR [Peptoniphilaceae bacterium]